MAATETVAEVVEDAAGGARPEDGLTTGDAAQDRGDLVFIGVLEQVAACAGTHRGQQQLVVLEHREHDDADRRVGGGDAAGRLDPVELGHAQVHDDEIGGELIGELDDFVSVGGDGDDVDAVELADQMGEAVAEDGMVVGDDDTEVAGTHAGNLTAIVVPMPVVLVIETSPPAALARLAIERRPIPAAVVGSKPQPLSRMAMFSW